VFELYKQNNFIKIYEVNSRFRFNIDLFVNINDLKLIDSKLLVLDANKNYFYQMKNS